MRKIILFLFFLSSLCKAQSRDSTVIIQFNKHSADFTTLKFGLTFPPSIQPDSVNYERHYVTEDKFERNFTTYRFKGSCMGFNAHYYVLCIDSIVHLVSINIPELDSTKATHIMKKISKKLEPLKKTNYGPNTESHFNFQKEFCTSLNWLRYAPLKKDIQLQLSDWFYCIRLEF